MKSYMEIYQKDVTSEMYEQLTFQEQMFGSSEHHVKTSHSQDLEKDWGGDRSSLVGEVFRLIEEKAEDKPEWLVYENVKGMLNTNNGWDFLSILLAMDGLGYDVEWQTLNSKDFGVPQNRERVYTIGHLRKYGRKQILPITNDSRQVNQLGEQINLNTITARYGNALSNGTYIIEGNECEQTSINQVASLNSDKRFNPNQYRVYGTDGLSPCLNTAQGGGLQPHVLVKSATMGGVRESNDWRFNQLGFP